MSPTELILLNTHSLLQILISYPLYTRAGGGSDPWEVKGRSRGAWPADQGGDTDHETELDQCSIYTIGENQKHRPPGCYYPK